MTKLSPQAQAVLDAAMQYEINPECYSREIAAAALRAAADQCHSQEIREADYTTRQWICLDDILAIAAELEGGND